MGVLLVWIYLVFCLVLGTFVQEKASVLEMYVQQDLFVLVTSVQAALSV